MKNFKNKWIYGKTVIMTGASGGIGFSVAKTLVENFNCKVIGIARNEEKIKNAISKISVNKENFSYLIFDVSKKENWEILTSFLDKNKIIPDVLFNNAGFMLPFKKFENITENEIEEIINTNFSSVVFGTKKILPYIQKSKSPAIINTSSAAGISAIIGESMYCATKFAVRGFTETLRVEYKKKIYVAGIYPGFIKTNILNRIDVPKKESKLVNKMMMPIEMATKKIIKGIIRKKNHITFGFQGRYLNDFGRLFPKTTANIIAFVLKKSNLEIFNDILDN